MRSSPVDLISNKLIISYGHLNSLLKEEEWEEKTTLSLTEETGETESAISTRWLPDRCPKEDEEDQKLLY